MMTRRGCAVISKCSCHRLPARQPAHHLAAALPGLPPGKAPGHPSQQIRQQRGPGIIRYRGSSDCRIVIMFHKPIMIAAAAPLRGPPVGSPGGIAPPGSHGTVRNNLSLHGSCRPGHQTCGTAAVHVHWAKNLGRSFTTAFHWSWALFRPRSRLYLFWDHRIK